MHVSASPFSISQTPSSDVLKIASNIFQDTTLNLQAAAFDQLSQRLAELQQELHRAEDVHPHGVRHQLLRLDSNAQLLVGLLSPP